MDVSGPLNTYAAKPKSSPATGTLGHFNYKLNFEPKTPAWNHSTDEPINPGVDAALCITLARMNRFEPCPGIVSKPRQGQTAVLAGILQPHCQPARSHWLASCSRTVNPPCRT